MKTSLLVLAIVVLFALAAIAARNKSVQRGGNGRPPTARPPLTEREQAMYFRLRDTFPDHVVLAQVAMSALLTSNVRATRNTFDRKVADFVLCSKAFEVVAVIELDDATHRAKAERDASRDSMVSGAGYRTLRFKQVPDTDALRASLAPKV